MIVSDKKKIIETPDDDTLNGVIGWCDTTGSFILYRNLDGLPILNEIPIIENEMWDKI